MEDTTLRSWGGVEQWQQSKRGGGEMARPLTGGEDAASQTT